MAALKGGPQIPESAVSQCQQALLLPSLSITWLFFGRTTLGEKSSRMGGL